MRQRVTGLGIAGIGVVCGLLLIGCAGTSVKRVSATEFMKRAAPQQRVNSACWQTYIGCSGTKAYVEFGSPAFMGGGVRTTVYWTPLSELSSNLVAGLRACQSKWPEATTAVPDIP